MLLGTSFHYEFSDAALTRVQFLLNKLRDEILDHNGIDGDHKERLLAKLEDLQRTLHKRTSSLDKFYGLIGEAGVLLGRFGHDAKPFVDRIRELMEIVWRPQATAKGLPASAKPALLRPPEGEG